MLETPRLILRAPVADDFEPYLQLHQDPQAARFVGGVLARDVAWRQFGHLRTTWELGALSLFSVVRRDTGAWIGMVGPWRMFGWPDADMRWEISRDAQGQGFGYEAAGRALDWLFADCAWPEVRVFIDAANTPARRLAEALGGRHLGEEALNAPFQTLRAETYLLTPASRRAAMEAKGVVDVTGIEPVTPSMSTRCSPAELHVHAAGVPGRRGV